MGPQGGTPLRAARAEAADRRERAAQVARDPEAKPTPKHIQRAQRALEDAERRHGAPAGQLLEMLGLLPGVLAEVQTPGEEPDEAKVYFGWSGLGRETQLPGSMRSS